MSDKPTITKRDFQRMRIRRIGGWIGGMIFLVWGLIVFDVAPKHIFGIVLFILALESFYVIFKYSMCELILHVAKRLLDDD